MAARPDAISPVNKPRRILIADDSETVTTLLRVALEQSGYEVTTASDGQETYELGKEGFDLVILDQLMPGLLGLEIIDKWREDGLDLKVIMLSGVDDEKTVVDSLDKGAVDYVRKPFQLTEILARVRHRLRD
ncbi:MAG TPA: response regulator transcription factor [Acidimicrobiia bacterium]|nr:response regulator transcription factor [Acidimicrobiia bacterium]